MTLDYQFDKSLRLLNSGDFKAVFDGASAKAHQQHFLILAKTNSLDTPRLGLVIAKKNIRLAVNRNKVKRIIRETFRHQQHQLGGIDAIVLARRGMDQLEPAVLHQQLVKQWQRLAKKLASQDSE